MKKSKFSDVKVVEIVRESRAHTKTGTPTICPPVDSASEMSQSTIHEDRFRQK